VESTYGLTRAELDREAWAIEPDGRRHGGAAAINRILAELGAPWSLLAVVHRLPLVRQVEELCYRWFATHRSWFARWGVSPECDEPEADCG
jgi:predicted DCC family thiol-disulfide oxidoreductase YuxK